MSVDVETVRKLAHLSRLAIKEEEIWPLQEKLNSILAFVEKLKDTDVSNVEPMTSVLPMKLSMREEDGDDHIGAALILANAPCAEGNFFTVPKVVE